MPSGGGGGDIAFLGGSMYLLGGLGGLCLGGCLLPCLGKFVGLLDWPAWVLRRLGGPLSSGEGRRAIGWEGRGVGGVLAWGRLASSPGGVGWEGRGVRGVLAWERLASSPGEVGREGRGVRGVLTWERLASSPGGVAPAWGRALSSPAWLLACKGAGEVLASPWGGPAWEDLLSSPGGTWEITWLLPREL